MNGLTDHALLSMCEEALSHLGHLASAIRARIGGDKRPVRPEEYAALRRMSLRTVLRIQLQAEKYPVTLDDWEAAYSAYQVRKSANMRRERRK